MVTLTTAAPVKSSLVLITATRNRAESLKRLLSSLVAQEFRDMHIILVDQSSQSGIRANQHLVDAFSDRINITHVVSTGTGLSKARNEGLALVRGADVIAFPDDDCYYPLDLVRNVYGRFASLPEIDVLLGQYGEPPEGYNPRFPQKPFRISPLNAFGASVGFFFSSKVFLQSRIRFDERIGAGTAFPAAEELDVLLGALAMGHQAYYDPSIVVYHAVKSPLTAPERRSGAEVARSYVLAKHWGKQNLLFKARVIGRTSRVALQAIHDKSARSRLVDMIKGYRLASLVRQTDMDDAYGDA